MGLAGRLAATAGHEPWQAIILQCGRLRRWAAHDIYINVFTRAGFIHCGHAIPNWPATHSTLQLLGGQQSSCSQAGPGSVPGGNCCCPLLACLLSPDHGDPALVISLARLHPPYYLGPRTTDLNAGLVISSNVTGANGSLMCPHPAPPPPPPRHGSNTPLQPARPGAGPSSAVCCICIDPADICICPANESVRGKAC